MILLPSLNGTGHHIWDLKELGYIFAGGGNFSEEMIIYPNDPFCLFLICRASLNKGNSARVTGTSNPVADGPQRVTVQHSA